MAGGAIERKDVISDEAFEAPLLWADRFEKVAIELNKVVNSAAAAGKAIASSKETRQHKKAVDDLARAEQRLVKANSEMAKKIAVINQQIAEKNKRNKEEARQTLGLVGAYDKLTKELNDARKAYKDLAASGTASTKALKEQEKVVNRLNARVTAIDKTVGQFQRNVGNYPKLLAGVGKAFAGFFGAFGLIEGIRFGAQFLKDAKAVAEAAKGIEFAFERLGERGAKAFEDVRRQTRNTLSDLDIKTALVEFDNFNISLEESATLFEFLSVRATQTGKSIEYLRDSLVEGLSKESKLRIDNLGISAKELNEQLKKTPNFVSAVAAIAKKEIAEAGNILDEAASAQQRYNAAFKNFQLAVGQKIVAEVSNAFLNLGAAVLKAITPTEDLTKAVRDEQRQLNILVTKAQAAAGSEEERRKVLEQIQKLYPDFLKNLDTETVTNEELAKQLNAANKQYILKIALAKQDQAIQEQLQRVGRATLDVAEQQQFLLKIIANANRQGAKLDAAAFKDRASAMAALKKEYVEGRLGLESYRIAVESVSRFFDVRKKDLAEEEEALFKVREEYGRLKATIVEMLGLEPDLVDMFDKSTEDSEKSVEKLNTLTKDQIDLLRFRAEQHVKENRRIAEDENATADERIAALNRVHEFSKEIADLDRQQALLAEDLTTHQRQLINEKYFATIKDLEQQNADDRKRILLEISEFERQVRLNVLDRQLKQNTDAFAKELEEFKKQKEFMAGINERFNDRLVKDMKKRNERLKEQEKKRTEDFLAEQERRRAIEDAAITLGQSIFFGALDNRQERLSLESEQLEERRQKELEAAGDDERKKLAINKKFDREQAKIRQKQANAQKLGALFDIAINTAVGITSALRMFPPNPILAGIIAATGAAQALLVAARPVPKFFKGSDYTPSTFIAGDAPGGGSSTEIVSKGGKSIVVDRPTLFTGMAGATVIPQPKAQEILGTLEDARLRPRYMSTLTENMPVIGQIMESHLIETNNLLRKIESKPIPSWVMDKHGFREFIVNGLSKTEYVNKRFGSWS